MPDLKKILVVDDQAEIRKLVRMTIGSAYEVLEAADGKASLEIIRTHRISLVVLDIMMPGEMDGLGVLDAIRAHPVLREIKVIIVSARGQLKDYETGMSRGADAYLIKPFSPINLVDKMKKMLG